MRAIGLQIFHVWALVSALQALLDGNAPALLGQLAGAFLFLSDEKQPILHRLAISPGGPAQAGPSLCGKRD